MYESLPPSIINSPLLFSKIPAIRPPSSFCE
uniref:Uncharacterized protein n=1 Tax=virus sp. ctQ5V6 TaxID=2825815 RepID=A0A8S5RQ17_9VIRU|nr:MAG TPA: hypothetical protein [virus sp. ctQ5V6]